jgi:hypothetical protein
VRIVMDAPKTSNHTLVLQLALGIASLVAAVACL